MPQKNRQQLIRELLEDTDREFDDEQLMDQLVEQKVTNNSNDSADKRTFGQRSADAVARFAGSWAFIFSFLLVMAVWMVVNFFLAARAFDAYPFILLNLVLSCVAAIQAPLIMMSQNRQEAKDRERAENDYKVNLKTELIIDDLHVKLDHVLENQTAILSLLQAEQDNKKDEDQNK